MIVIYVDYATDRPLALFGPKPEPGVPRRGESVQIDGETGMRSVSHVEWRTASLPPTRGTDQKRQEAWVYLFAPRTVAGA